MAGDRGRHRLCGATGRLPDNPRLATLVRELTAGNEQFAVLWSDGTVGTHREDFKSTYRPAVGRVTVNCDLLADGDPDQKIVVMTTAPGNRGKTALQLATLAGTPTATGTGQVPG